MMIAMNHTENATIEIEATMVGDSHDGDPYLPSYSVTESYTVVFAN